jgi:hypothetical protein
MVRAARHFDAVLMLRRMVDINSCASIEEIL